MERTRGSSVRNFQRSIFHVDLRYARESEGKKLCESCVSRRGYQRKGPWA